MKEKRIGPDTIMNIISGISIILWIIILGIFILLAIANPTNAGLTSARPGIKSSGIWTTGAISGLLIIQIFLSFSGIIFNMARLKRKTDHMRMTFVFSAIVGTAGIIFIIFS